MKIVGFSGKSNSGKTTIIEKISTILNKNHFKVSIIKHDPKSKSITDTEGKDSHRFFDTNANVALVSSKKTTLFIHQNDKKLCNIIDFFKDSDYVLIEGFKDNIDIKRIYVTRDMVEEKYASMSTIISSDFDKNHLDLNNPQEIIDWIDNNIEDK